MSSMTNLGYRMSGLQSKTLHQKPSQTNQSQTKPTKIQPTTLYSVSCMQVAVMGHRVQSWERLMATFLFWCVFVQYEDVALVAVEVKLLVGFHVQ